ncbi:MAG: leucine--tRNA ligase [Chloroflexi bacterium]|nr:leucine--tRNA ligase [Chloroflexota bacterium]
MTTIRTSKTATGNPAAPDGARSDSGYAPDEIEAKWQRRWDADKLYRAEDAVPGKENWYALTMFPYPSGDVHIGHWFAYTPADAHARFMRMQGYNVMHPQGFDSFGLPAENAAISRGADPRQWTISNMANMRRQFKLMGASYDWSRELSTCFPEYYRWNQHFFLKFFEKGIAYRKNGAANWCPKDQTTLANEQVRDGTCERCGTVVVRREMPQWYFRITDYADELLEMDGIDWPEKIKLMQRNWIGRSTGVTIGFDVSEYVPGDGEQKIETFTTRIDTVYGVTFVVLAPEHPLAEKLTQPDRKSEVEAYIENARRQSEIERTSTEHEKTGVHTGAFATNPLNGERVPVLIGDYVLATYGTGAVMGVPAHDQRDFIFAKRFGLPIRVVVAPEGWNGEELPEAFVASGTQVNSGEFDGMPSGDGIERIADKIESNGWGRRTVTFHLRDWLISRQRYWGTPIPIIYCDGCGTVPVPEQDLPVLLPENAEFTPTGQSPLTLDEQFVNVPCPDCGRPARRETDTMDTFVDSSWYHLRFTSPGLVEEPFDSGRVKKWVPVHQYMGGAEHAVMHLLYARFFNKALRDLGFVEFDEPYARLFNQGTLTRDHMKISKRANPLNPEPIVERFGADTLRCYLMFLGPWDQGGDWSDQAINGVHRWLRRVWDLALRDAPSHRGAPAGPDPERELERVSHAATGRVITEMRQFKFNTTMAALMEYTNDLTRFWESGNISPQSWAGAVERLLLHMSPLAPHIAEELWERTGHSYSVHQQATPAWDESKAASDNETIVFQVNGRVRDQQDLPAGVSEDAAVTAALASEKVQRHTGGAEIVKKIFVPGKLVNIVVRPRK